MKYSPRSKTQFFSDLAILIQTRDLQSLCCRTPYHFFTTESSIQKFSSKLNIISNFLFKFPCNLVNLKICALITSPLFSNPAQPSYLSLYISFKPRTVLSSLLYQLQLSITFQIFSLYQFKTKTAFLYINSSLIHQIKTLI